MPQIRRLEPMVLTLAAVLMLAFPRPAPGTPSQDLARLATVYWEGQLKAHPTMATSIGDRRYDDRLEDNTPAGIAAEQRRLEWVLGRARAIDEKRLGPPDRRSYHVVRNPLAHLNTSGPKTRTCPAPSELRSAPISSCASTP